MASTCRVVKDVLAREPPTFPDVRGEEQLSPGASTGRGTARTTRFSTVTIILEWEGDGRKQTRLS